MLLRDQQFEFFRIKFYYVAVLWVALIVRLFVCLSDF